MCSSFFIAYIDFRNYEKMRNYQKIRIARKNFIYGFIAGMLVMYLSMKYFF